MLQFVVRTAEGQKNNKDLASGKCLPLPVPNVGKRIRCLLNQKGIDLFFAESVLGKRRERERDQYKTVLLGGYKTV